jgi:ribonuclease HII
MIAAAVIWPAEDTWSEELRSISAGIQDSKALTPKRRAIAEQAIKEHAIAYGIGHVDAAEIDTLGMTAANRLAFTRALEALAVKPQRLLVDGCISVVGSPYGSLEQIVEAKADGVYLPVAAASILAKEEHDRLIVTAAAADPLLQERYAILKGKGYGTALHAKGLLTHGPYQGHRRLFLRNLLGHDIYQKPDAAGPECLIED